MGRDGSGGGAWWCAKLQRKGVKMATVQQRIVAALLSFRLSPNLSLHTLRAPFIYSFIHITSPHPLPQHHCLAWPGLALPCLALPCLACLLAFSVPHQDSSSSCCPPDNDDNSDPDVQQQQHFLLFLSRIESILL